MDSFLAYFGRHRFNIVDVVMYQTIVILLSNSLLWQAALVWLGGLMLSIVASVTTKVIDEEAK